MRKFLMAVVVLLAACVQAASSTASLSGSAEISMLTCAPGQAIWTHYGHSAIRIHDPEKGIDLCFNYGLFNFNAPNFAGRFISGQTDYLLGYCRTATFIEDYRSEGRSIHQQTLNLSASEKEALWQALRENAKKENRQYRYNFFYDNCATRARKIVERNIEGKVCYDSTLLYPSLRASLKHYTATHPWADFGISFLIAAEADRPATFSDLLYAPGEMQIALQTASICSGDSLRPLVKSSCDLLSFPDSQTASSLDKNHPKNKLIDSVFASMCLLLALNLLLMFFERKNRKKCFPIDIFLYLIAGVSGLLLCYLALGSQHPAVHHNWLILWLQPLHLGYAIALCFPAFRKSKIAPAYAQINSLLCLLMIIAAIIVPQHIHPACWPLVAIFVLRSLAYVPPKSY